MAALLEPACMSNRLCNSRFGTAAPLWRPRCTVATRASRGRDNERTPDSAPSPSDLLFEGSRWRWPSRPSPLRPPPPPPPPGPGFPPRSPPGTFGTQSRNSRPPPLPPPPPPPPPPDQQQQKQLPNAPNWAEPLLRNDPELQQLLAESPELWAELQKRAGKNPKYVPPPNMDPTGADPAEYDRQLQQWLRYRRAQAASGGQAGARQDDEVKSIALLYLSIAVPLLLFGLLSAW